MNEVPDMLTVTEAGSILRIGRTTAYTRAKQWEKTDGKEGLPAIHVGRLLRVPTAQFEEHYHIRVTWRGDDLGVADRPKPKPAPQRHSKETEFAPAQAQRKRNQAVGNQTALPFTG